MLVLVLCPKYRQSLRSLLCLLSFGVSIDVPAEILAELGINDLVSSPLGSNLFLAFFFASLAPTARILLGDYEFF